ncbi:hypothetical protein Efla_006566 [Eimeria flavescens]
MQQKGKPAQGATTSAAAAGASGTSGRQPETEGSGGGEKKSVNEQTGSGGQQKRKTFQIPAWLKGCSKNDLARDSRTPGGPTPTPVGSIYLTPTDGAEKVLIILAGDSTPWKPGDSDARGRDPQGKTPRGTVWSAWLKRDPRGPKATQDPNEGASGASLSSPEGPAPASSSGTSGRHPEQPVGEGNEGRPAGRDSVEETEDETGTGSAQ